MGRISMSWRDTPVRVGLLGLSLLAAAAVPAPARAQAPEPVAQNAWCHRGRPAPACRRFVLTEFGLLTELSPAEPNGGRQLRAEWQAGPMFSFGPRAAVGATLSVQSEPDFLFALRGRYRTWLNPRVGFDLAPGVLFGRWDSGGADFGDLSFSGQAGVSYKDLVGLTLQLEYTPEPSVPVARRLRRTHIGARLGGKLGAAAGIIVGIGYVALASSEW